MKNSSDTIVNLTRDLPKTYCVTLFCVSIAPGFLQVWHLMEMRDQLHVSVSLQPDGHSIRGIFGLRDVLNFVRKYTFGASPGTESLFSYRPSNILVSTVTELLGS